MYILPKIRKSIEKFNQHPYRISLFRAFMFGMMCTLIWDIIFSEINAAAGDLNNIEEAGRQAMKPITQLIDKHWGKAVGASGISASFLGEGDMRQRATRGAIGSVGGGAIILGIRTLFLGD